MRFGIKINRFIDRTNINTKMLKRGLNVSSPIYDFAKSMTFLAINITVAEVILPVGSIMSVIGKIDVLHHVRVHSRMILVSFIIRINEINSIGGTIDIRKNAD